MRTRTFIALALPTPVRDAIAALPGRSWRSGLRWSPAADAHLTLVFLGDLEADEVALVHDGASAVARAARPFEASLRGAGAFPHPSRGRVLWLGWGEGAEAVANLQAALRARLRAAGRELDERSFHAHVTGARARLPRDLRAEVAVLQGWVSASWRVDALDVMASRLTPAGAVHALLARYRLSAGEADEHASSCIR
jgi:RNA 2',3'-cyclic 3'-phosphodiesterase